MVLCEVGCKEEETPPLTNQLKTVQFQLHDIRESN